MTHWIKPTEHAGAWTVPTYAESLCRSCSHGIITPSNGRICNAHHGRVAHTYTCQSFEFAAGLADLWDAADLQ